MERPSRPRMFDRCSTETMSANDASCPERGPGTRHNGRVKSVTFWRTGSVREDSLRHILVAGGSIAEWQAFTEDEWRARLDDLVAVARRAGARFVTVHPHDTTDGDGRSGDGASPVGSLRRRVERDGVMVVVDPVVDGRDRIVDVVERWPKHRRLNEKRLSRALFDRAGEPDLVVILGRPDLLPTSLVWELAYGELFFLQVHWADLGAEHIRTAIEEFARRQRRFGGVE